MKKLASLLILIGAIYWSFDSLLPSVPDDQELRKNEFSVVNAMAHLKVISQKEHYLGSAAHAEVRDYIIKELEKLGFAPETQKGLVNSMRLGDLASPENILARKKGSGVGKALVLMSHYDSAPHSSFGASDAGTGVVTILEGLRAYLSENPAPRNDIIVLITDGEELGLNGAELFVKEHRWAKDVGIVLNFEARGSGGPSYMLMETNGGNTSMVNAFAGAGVEYPVSNSLAYSIYKLLPNDTDLTVFRERGDIDGYNFAFIDDHYDYHTARDNYNNLNINTLQHQGSYLMPMLRYLAKKDLSLIKAEVNDDTIYFNTPLGFFTYPFSWAMPMFIATIFLFLGVLIYGLKKTRLTAKGIGKGFVAFLLVILLTGSLSYYLWPFLNWLYPGYGDMLHGFPYNGHDYIAFTVFISIAIAFAVYRRYRIEKGVANFVVPPLFVWLLFNGFLVFELRGATFFIIPVFIGIAMLFLSLRQRHPNVVLLSILGAFPLLILAIFAVILPVGLGLDALITTALVTVLLFGLLIPVLGRYRRKRVLSVLFFLIAFIFFIKAHFNADFNAERQKPNSLVYLIDTDNGTAHWATYDRVLDGYTKAMLGENPKPSSEEVTFNSKYGSQWTYAKTAPVKEIPVSQITMSKDTVVDGIRQMQFELIPQRLLNRMEFFAPEEVQFYRLSVNGVSVLEQKDSDSKLVEREGERIFYYFRDDQAPIEVHMEVPNVQPTQLVLYEISYDLLDHPLFSVPERTDAMIPMPFVVNDAIIAKQTLRF